MYANDRKNQFIDWLDELCSDAQEALLIDAVHEAKIEVEATQDMLRSHRIVANRAYHNATRALHEYRLARFYKWVSVFLCLALSLALLWIVK